MCLSYCIIPRDVLHALSRMTFYGGEKEAFLISDERHVTTIQPYLLTDPMESPRYSKVVMTLQ